MKIENLINRVIRFRKDFDTRAHAESYANKKYAKSKQSRISYTIEPELIDNKVRYVLTATEPKDSCEQMNLF